MLVHLHIGLDKAGSTAIQYHMWLNRDWYANQEIFIPETGFVFAGHQVLFKEMFPHDMGALEEEVKLARSNGFEQCFISWEGIHELPPERLQILKDLFPGSKFKIYVYLREQSETIQSGYLQQVKQGSATLSMVEARTSKAYLNAHIRDYKAMLDKFAHMFGKESIHVNVYDRKILLEGDVIKDMLATMGLTADADFIFAQQESNISLDVPGARLMNELDCSQDFTHRERMGIVDLLLCDISAHGSGEKYFLNEQEAAGVQQFFRDSNRAVVKGYLGADWPYPDLFPYNKKTHTDTSTTDQEQAVAAKRRMLEEFNQHRSWDGKQLDGDSMAWVARQDYGWLAADDAGVRPGRDSVELHFRVMWKHVRPVHCGVRLAMVCEFPKGCGRPEVEINGSVTGALRSGNNRFIIPFETMDKFRRIDVSITHVPKSNSPSDRFTLKAIRFGLVKMNDQDAVTRSG